MKARGDAVILLILAVMVALGLLLAVSQSGEQESRVMPNRTTYSATPGGCKALFVTLQSLGVRVRRYGGPLGHIPSGRAIFIISPRVAVTETDWSQLQNWVREGHLAVVAVDHPLDVLEAPEKTGEATTVPFGPGNGLQHLIGWGRWRVPQRIVIDSEHVREREPWGLDSFPDEVLRDAVPLASDDHGVLAAWAACGRGAFLLCHAGVAFSNECVGQGDTLPFLMNALQRFPGDEEVWFDETHHGFPDQEGGLWGIMPGEVKAGLLQIVLALLLGCVYLGTRTRPPLPTPGIERSRAEYLASLAGLLSRGRAVSVALQEEAESFPKDLPPLLAAQAEPLLVRARQAGRRNEAEALALIRKLRHIEEVARDQV